MTLNTGIFDVSDPQNPDRVYSAALLCRMMAKQIRDGIVHEDGGEMAVTVTDPPAMTVLVGTGTAMVQGRFCENDAAMTLAVPTAHATYPRIDRVVVRLNASPGRTIDIVVKPGTAAPTPAAPALTRTAETWELSLAQVRVEAGATSIIAAKITDERANTSLCGVAAPVYVPSSQLEVVGAVDMQGKALTGLPVPSAATDAARRNMGGATLQNLGTPSATTDAATKAYVDSATVPTLSQLVMDADKNCNGKNFSNMGKISPKTWLVLIGNDPLIISKTTSSSTTVTFTPQIDGTGHVKVVVLGSVVTSQNRYGSRTFQLLKNGIVVWTKTQATSTVGEAVTKFDELNEVASADLPVVSGDVLTITLSVDTQYLAYGNATVQVYATPLVAPYQIAS